MAVGYLFSSQTQTRAHVSSIGLVLYKKIRLIVEGIILTKNYRFVGIAGLMCVCGLFRFSLCNFLKKFFKCVVISNALNPKVFITNNLERQFPYSSPPLFVSSLFECDALFPFLFEGSRATARRSSLGWCKFSTGPYYHHGILFERGKGLTFYI